MRRAPLGADPVGLAREMGQSLLLIGPVFPSFPRAEDFKHQIPVAKAAGILRFAPAVEKEFRFQTGGYLPGSHQPARSPETCLFPAAWRHMIDLRQI